MDQRNKDIMKRHGREDDTLRLCMVELDQEFDHKKIYITKKYLTRVQPPWRAAPAAVGGGAGAPDGPWTVHAHGDIFSRRCGSRVPPTLRPRRAPSPWPAGAYIDPRRCTRARGASATCPLPVPRIYR